MHLATFKVLTARLNDFKFYMATKRRGHLRITMITLDLVPHPKLGLALQKAEKPLYLCAHCRTRLLTVAWPSQISHIPSL
jgi:hypothetical protein